MSRISALRTYQPRHTSHIPGYRLDELFTDDELALKLLIAQYRILMAFDHATFWSHGKLRGTDNFIIGVGHRQKDLVQYIVERVVIGMKSGIVTASELPEFVGDTSSVLRDVARNTERQLVAVQLAMLSPDSIWFNAQTPGTWNVVQSLVDEYRLHRKLANEAKRVDARLRREALHNGGRLMVVH
ncbi:hypothetical protein RAAC3_TM7C00001G0387 [Candidatus Saccharibacteria bacterium RAAC3_TM7_1]|nr:hypothetical protein RAAC3_TM7C00001G0387 [Candidatus Saccharibacteria bacterium RAAC3_TM7_1]HCZ28726.1 hypothetical protein [Candidatus Saccharibacteria bacterium]